MIASIPSTKRHLPPPEPPDYRTERITRVVLICTLAFALIGAALTY